MGWSLSFPRSLVDTRWGAPRFDAALETETYLLGGRAAHAGGAPWPLQPRAAEKTFRPARRGDFQDRPARDRSFELLVGGHGQGRARAPSSAARAPRWPTWRDGSQWVAERGPRSPRQRDQVRLRRGRRHGRRRRDRPGPTSSTSSGSTTRQLARRARRVHGDVPARHRAARLRPPSRRQDRRARRLQEVTAQLLRRIVVDFHGRCARPVVRPEVHARRFREDPARGSHPAGRGRTGLPHPPLRLPRRRPAGRRLYRLRATERGARARTTCARPSWTSSLRCSARTRAGPRRSAATRRTSGGHLYLGFNPDAPTKQARWGPRSGKRRTVSSEGLLALVDLNGDSSPTRCSARTGRSSSG